MEVFSRALENTSHWYILRNELVIVHGRYPRYLYEFACPIIELTTEACQRGVLDPVKKLTAPSFWISSIVPFLITFIFRRPDGPAAPSLFGPNI
jgi:hypothetical protein